MGTAVSLVRTRQNDNISSALEWVIGILSRMDPGPSSGG